jgi:hypothetical protein
MAMSMEELFVLELMSAPLRASHNVVDFANISITQIYLKRISLSKTVVRELERRLERNPALPKWDIFIRPLNG